MNFVNRYFIVVIHHHVEGEGETGYRELRGHLIRSNASSDYYIPKESPLYNYFCSDNRADGVLIRADGIDLVGPSEVDQTYVGIQDESSIKCPTLVYSIRKCERDDYAVENAFKYPFHDEIKGLETISKDLSALMSNALGILNKGMTEREISKVLQRELCNSDFVLQYNLIVSGDANTLELWRVPGKFEPKEMIYLEAGVSRNGLSGIYGETIFLKEIDDYSSDYSEIIKGKELLRKKFIEGNRTTDLQSIETLRNPRLFLTTPLFPYQHIEIPGENRIIHARETSVFDFWVMRKNYAVRKKITAIAGPSEGIIL